MKPQVHEASSGLSDKVEEIIVIDRIDDPLYVFVTSEYGWVSECGALYESAGISTNSYMMSKKTVEVNPRTLDHDRVEGGQVYQTCWN